MERGKEVIGFKKRRKIKTEKLTQAEQSNCWRGMREDTVMKKKRDLAITNSDSLSPAKPFIPDKYNNHMNLKKIMKIKYFTKALLELIARVFSEEEVSRCANNITAVEKLVVWQKSLPNYIEGD